MREYLKIKIKSLRKRIHIARRKKLQEDREFNEKQGRQWKKSWKKRNNEINEKKRIKNEREFLKIL